jgi:aspartyl-tRNA(Asn)/glutamyl-tRNA(Gln) amidotransferase subunit A
MEDQSKPTIARLSAALASGRATSRDLVEAALARIDEPGGEGARTFLHVYRDEARAAADAQDTLRRAGYRLSPLAGLPVSIKDLFDVAGERTRAGSKVLDDAPVARQDAPVVARLRRAGAVLIGRTNMTEFAFSGVGINPHHGTPGNPFDRRRIPGGSSSGAPVSVIDGQAVVAIGTDTGGSVRIPAALCGIVGFKPTQRRVPRDGVVPLSATLDSVGPLGNSVACCILADAVMAGEEPALPPAMPPSAMRLAVPQSFVLDDLEPAVAAAFERACRALSAAGARVQERPLAELAQYPELTARGGFAAAEAYAWHARLLARRADQYDPRVRVRIEAGRGMSAPDYIALIARRAAFIERVEALARDWDALVMPTVPIAAPPFAAFGTDAEFGRLNARLLRTPSLVNFLDGCAVTLPIHEPGQAPVGLMLVGRRGTDHRLLALALGVEAALAPPFV